MIISSANKSRFTTLLVLLAIVALWHVLTMGGGSGTAADDEYALLSGQASGASSSIIPGPGQTAARALELFGRAFDSSNPNNVGIAWHLLHSLGRVMLGFGLAAIVAVPVGFVLGVFPPLYKSVSPVIEVLRPVSPLAWMPLALYTLQSSSAAIIFIIFICALWPMLINTAAGAIGVRREWVNVSRVFGLSPLRHIVKIVLPASLPMMLTGMRLSIGTAWFVIVAAEMVGTQSGIGYFIWNEWNNLDIASMLVAILLIGMIGVGLDATIRWVGNKLAYVE